MLIQIMRPKQYNQPKNNNLNHIDDLTIRIINRLFVFAFRAGNNDPRRISFDKYYMKTVEIKLLM